MTMKVDARISALRFIYPFLFRADEFGMRVAAIERATWAGSRQPITVWGRQEFPVDNLLAYVADFVNPRDDAPLTAGFVSARNAASASTPRPDTLDRSRSSPHRPEGRRAPISSAPSWTTSSRAC